MPLLQIPALPSMARVAQEGVRVRPTAADRPLRVGLLNMMPDRALEATERQFLRLLDAHDERCCAVRLFGIRGVPRGDANGGVGHPGADLRPHNANAFPASKQRSAAGQQPSRL